MKILFFLCLLGTLTTSYAGQYCISQCNAMTNSCLTDCYDN